VVELEVSITVVAIAVVSEAADEDCEVPLMLVEVVLVVLTLKFDKEFDLEGWVSTVLTSSSCRNVSRDEAAFAKVDVELVLIGSVKSCSCCFSKIEASEIIEGAAGLSLSFEFEGPAENPPNKESQSSTNSSQAFSPD